MGDKFNSDKGAGGQPLMAPAYVLSLLRGERKLYARSAQEIYTESFTEEEEMRLAVDNTLFFTDDPAAVRANFGKNAAILLHLTEETRKLSFAEYPYAAEEASLPETEEIVRIWCRAKGLPLTIAETKRLRIREFTPEDLDLLYAIYEDAEGIGEEERLSEDREIERARLEDLTRYVYPIWGFGLWLVLRISDGEPVGRMGLFIREGEEIPELGYTVRASLRGQGYAKEALEAILAWAEENEIDTLQARCAVNNAASAHLLSALGFVPVGQDTVCDSDEAVCPGEAKIYWKKTGQHL